MYSLDVQMGLSLGAAGMWRLTVQPPTPPKLPREDGREVLKEQCGRQVTSAWLHTRGLLRDVQGLASVPSTPRG